MTEAELLSQASEWLNAGVDSITLYLSVLFAYFVVAHLVGKKLTTAQLGVIATIYSVIMITGLVTINMQFTAIDRFIGDLTDLGSKYVPALPSFSVPVVVGMYALAFLASHYYMYSSRTMKSDEGSHSERSGSE